MQRPVAPAAVAAPCSTSRDVAARRYSGKIRDAAGARGDTVAGTGPWKSIKNPSKIDENDAQERFGRVLGSGSVPELQDGSARDALFEGFGATRVISGSLFDPAERQEDET